MFSSATRRFLQNSRNKKQNAESLRTAYSSSARFYQRWGQSVFFSSSSSRDKNNDGDDEYDNVLIPESSYDEDREDRKEFVEKSTSTKLDGGLTSLSSPKKKFTVRELQRLHEMDEEGISVVSDDLYDEIEGNSEFTHDEKITDDELIKLMGDQDGKLSGTETFDDEKLMELFEVMDTDFRESDFEDESIGQERRDYPRSDEDYERLMDVDGNPNSFPSFPKDERRKMGFEMSKDMYHQDNSLNAEDEDDEGKGSFGFGEQDDEFALPREFSNYSLPQRTSDEYPEPLLDKFMPDTAGEKFRFDEQGLRSCPGKRQRAGVNGVLHCHRIDLSTLHYLDTINLARFLSGDGEIERRETTGLCSKCQRKVAKTVKRARNFGILPRIGEYVLQESYPRRSKTYHITESKHIPAKTNLGQN